MARCCHSCSCCLVCSLKGRANSRRWGHLLLQQSLGEEVAAWVPKGSGVKTEPFVKPLVPLEGEGRRAASAR